MSTNVPEHGELSPLTDTENVQMEVVETEPVSIETAYAWLADVQAPPVQVPDEV